MDVLCEKVTKMSCELELRVKKVRKVTKDAELVLAIYDRSLEKFQVSKVFGRCYFTNTTRVFFLETPLKS